MWGLGLKARAGGSSRTWSRRERSSCPPAPASGTRHIFLPKPDQRHRGIIYEHCGASGFAVAKNISRRSHQRGRREHHGERERQFAQSVPDAADVCGHCMGRRFRAHAISPQAVNNQVNIPSDGGLAMANIFSTEIAFDGFNYWISNINSSPHQLQFDHDHHPDEQRGQPSAGVEQSGQHAGAVLPVRVGHEHVGGGRVGRAGVDAGFFCESFHADQPQPGAAQGDAHQRRAGEPGRL